MHQSQEHLRLCAGLDIDTLHSTGTIKASDSIGSQVDFGMAHGTAPQNEKGSANHNGTHHEQA